MTMKDLKIKITGSGDKQMLVFALKELAAIILNYPTSKLENGVDWNDGIIRTEINSELNSEDLVECDGCGEVIPETDLYCRNCGNENF